MSGSFSRLRGSSRQGFTKPKSQSQGKQMDARVENVGKLVIEGRDRASRDERQTAGALEGYLLSPLHLHELFLAAGIDKGIVHEGVARA
jgi:hypothetical protein